MDESEEKAAIPEWMIDDDNWGDMPAPGKGWHGLGWFTVRDPENQTEAQLDRLDFSAAVVLQKETGYN